MSLASALRLMYLPPMWCQFVFKTNLAARWIWQAPLCVVLLFGWCKFYKAGQRGRAAWLWGRLKTAPFKGKYGYFPMLAKQKLCDLQSALRHQDNDGAPRVSAGRRKASRGSTRACQTSNGQTPQGDGKCYPVACHARLLRKTLRST